MEGPMALELLIAAVEIVREEEGTDLNRALVNSLKESMRSVAHEQNTPAGDVAISTVHKLVAEVEAYHAN
jgi:hypothetical protein